MKSAAIAIVCCCLLGLRPATSSAAVDPFETLKFRNIGPAPGRIDAVAGVARDPLTYYAGGLGGLFKSSDGGITWKPVFNRKPVSAIGAVAVAPSDHNVVYAGTGEPNLRNDIIAGDGVWQSTDAGKTWHHAGLEGTEATAQIAVDPRDPDTAYVAAVGTVYKPSVDRGIFKTTDGGRSWKKILYLDDRTGASSVVIDPSNPRVLFAGMWEGWRTPYSLNSGGPNDGVYTSSDSGEHWTRVKDAGLPQGLMGRIGLAYAPGNSDRLYALIESRDGVLWRSDDGGESWSLASRNHALAQRPFYFSELAVDPSNEDHVFFMSVSLMESRDGGTTAHKMAEPGGDNHQMWIDPSDGKRMIVGSDAGVQISSNGGKTWAYPPLLIAQPYHVATDDRTPYTVCGEFQDSGAACAPSNSLTAGGITPDLWFSPAGGESGWIVFDRADDNYIYGSGYTGDLTRYDRRTQQVRPINPWPDDSIGAGAADLKYRFQWTAPLATSPWDPHAVYFGGNRLFKTTDRGTTWTAVSPDLTRNDKSKQQPSGGPITYDNTSVEYYDTIFCVAESPVRAGVLWAGTDDGLVWRSDDAGAHWTNLTANVPGKPEFGRIDYIDPSHFDAAAAIMVVDAHTQGDHTAHLYATHDAGLHWTSIGAGLPEGSYGLMVREDPVRRGMLYAGTDSGLWLSYDGGAAWQRLASNLPTSAIFDFVVQPRYDDLVVASHGRGVWILDDLRPLQEYTPQIAAKAAYLFTVRPAYRWSALEGSYVLADGAGDDPVYGADINLYLREKPSKERSVSVQILNGSTVVQTLKVEKLHAGVNRLYWNLRYDKITPAADSDAWDPTGFRGPPVLPGDYTVKVTAGGESLTRQVTVIADPRSKTGIASLRSQFAFLMKIRSDLERMTKEIVRLRSAREQLASLKGRIASTPAAAKLDPAIDALSAKVDASLSAIYQPRNTVGEDVLRFPSHTYEKLSSLAGFATGSDDPPTASDREVLAQFEAAMSGELDDAAHVLGPELSALNQALANSGVAGIYMK